MGFEIRIKQRIQPSISFWNKKENLTILLIQGIYIECLANSSDLQTTLKINGNVDFISLDDQTTLRQLHSIAGIKY